MSTFNRKSYTPTKPSTKQTTESPIIKKTRSLKRQLNTIEEENKVPEKKTKMGTPLTLEHLQDIYSKIKNDQDANTGTINARIDTNTATINDRITASEDTITGKICNMQNDITTIKAKQDQQECTVSVLTKNQETMNVNQADILKRLESLERGEKVKTNNNNKSNLSAYQERLREQVAKTCMKVAIYDLPNDKDTDYIRLQADTMKVTQEIKDEIRNNKIELIPDKRTGNPKNKNGKLYHLTTSGIQARQSIIYAAKDKPGKMRWDIIVPKDFRAGYNKQKSMVWMIRNGLNLSAQIEIHGHTSFVYINEKASIGERRVLSEFTPTEKPPKRRRGGEDMETNVDDNNEDDKPIINYTANKLAVDDLSSIIFWIGHKEEEDKKRMTDLSKILSTEDYNKITTKTVHTKYQSRLWFNNKEDSLYVYNKYKLDQGMEPDWKWSILKPTEFKME